MDERVRSVGEGMWQLAQTGPMRVPGIVFADRASIDELMADDEGNVQWSALQQVRNVAALPGIVMASLALPDIHPGYGFPIGGVGAFDAENGVTVVGGVGFDINCGVRLMATPLEREDIESSLDALGKALFDRVPAGLGAQGDLRLTMRELDGVLREGARDLVARGFGVDADLEYCEENGRMAGADPSAVSDRAKHRQLRQVGTLGSGNHYLELQVVEDVLDPVAADAYGLRTGQVTIAIHTGSRALGHQIGQDYLAVMSRAAQRFGFETFEKELACAPIESEEGRQYLAAVACGANCAFANRQMIGHRTREVLAAALGLAPSDIRTVYDIGHNNAKFETHSVGGRERRLLVHRKGSTRAFGPGRPESPEAYRKVGHPILAGGTMGTSSYVLRGTEEGMGKTFGSGVHGAGRALSRKKAAKKYWGETVASELASNGIRLWSHSLRGIAEEAPGAYKDIDRVVRAATEAGISRTVVRLRPIAVIKG